MQRNYNVTGNERKRMVQIIGEVLGIHPEYMRMPTCAFRIGSITVSKTGVVDWEDGVMMEPVFAALAKEGFLAEENPDLPTGLTISFQRDDSFTDQTVSNLQKLIASKAALIRKALAADQVMVSGRACHNENYINVSSRILTSHEFCGSEGEGADLAASSFFMRYLSEKF